MNSTVVVSEIESDCLYKNIFYLQNSIEKASKKGYSPVFL